ncbi:MAG: hypothetical protein R3B06_14940 [Kofleriaceae bacterium]
MTEPMVFLSASIPTDMEYPDGDRHRATARPAMIRDVVLAVTRAALRSGTGLVFGAHPSISPMILAVAREFRPPRPPIRVCVSAFFAGAYPAATLELADGKLGTLTEIPAAPVRGPDRARSLAVLRAEMLATPGLVGGIFVGGMDGILDEFTAFWSRPGGRLPAYVFGQPGGAARDLFERPPVGVGEDDCCGAPAAPVPVSMLRDPVPGYTRVARAIFAALAAVPAG